MKNPVLTDGVLLASYAKNNDERAFNKLWSKHKSKIYATIYNIVKEKNLAEDLLQDTFMKIIRNVQDGNYSEEGKFLPWACRIAHNLAIDYFRRSKKATMVEVEDRKEICNHLNFAEDSAEKQKIRQEVNEKLAKLIETLPENQKEVLMMRHYGEMSFQEIAEKTCVSINTALGRMRYALINLRKQAEKYNLNFSDYLNAYC
ncbi:RNA polymerase sigma factor [Raineya orbicola]|uniref:Sigma70-ECF: RNA polymerase sigma factor, sigma-70 family n=1 Tax=Raineya orbicola TaxID=2016530 RepID=A0A2N3IIS3_9BACT|nr:sigma-70 family RNA polymerase sigma factor [Raineya orbicola]PKQ70158.1 sigma70-ECF: RNA polymerase sigma factor, sigma-70 family [Raineya orbicola]